MTQVKWIMLMLMVFNLQPSMPGTLVSAGGTIGVNYGTNGDNLPAPADVVNMYKQHGFTKMRIFSPNPAILQAVQNTGISVVVGVVDNDLPTIAGSLDGATNWVNTNIVPYASAGASISFVTAGNEVIPGNLAQYVAPAIHNLQLALKAANLENIGVSTTVGAAALATSYPPSAGAFTSDSMDAMNAVLQELSFQGQPLMINVYPYFAYASDPVNVPLAYALFQSTSPVVSDGPYSYQYLFDAQIDAFNSAIEKSGWADVNLIVSESGWPSDGNGDATTPALASTYNKNLRTRVETGGGTPKKPAAPIETYIFAMFNEDQKTAGVEQHFGLFFPDGTPVYDF